MPPTALRTIHDEHAALAAMLRSILLLSQHRSQSTPPDFGTLRAMLFYVDAFPEKRHHLKESELLFPKLRARTAEAAALLDRLDQDHTRGEHAVRALKHALLGFEMMGEPRRAAFETAARQDVDFYLQYMPLEERQILPLAERMLTPQDWDALDAAFGANRDPLTAHEPEAADRALFTRIVNALRRWAWASGIERPRTCEQVRHTRSAAQQCTRLVADARRSTRCACAWRLDGHPLAHPARARWMHSRPRAAGAACAPRFSRRNRRPARGPAAPAPGSRAPPVRHRCPASAGSSRGARACP